MRLSNQSICRRCARPMKEVASIEPFGITPGLIAFLCIECGTTDSILVDPVSRGGQPNPRQPQEQH